MHEGGPIMRTHVYFYVLGVDHMGNEDACIFFVLGDDHMGSIQQ